MKEGITQYGERPQLVEDSLRALRAQREFLGSVEVSPAIARLSLELDLLAQASL